MFGAPQRNADDGGVSADGGMGSWGSFAIWGMRGRVCPWEFMGKTGQRARVWV